MNFATALRPLSPGLDWSALRFPGEMEVRREIEQIPALAETVSRWSSLNEVPRPLPYGLLSAGVRMSAAVSPALARIADILQELLRLSEPPLLVVFPSAEPFAELIPDELGAPPRIALSSELVRRLGVRETLFVVGRRIARQLLHQRPLLADPSVGAPRLDRETLLLRGLWRFQELSCDRFGLLCCQDDDLAARCILKIASGLPDELLLVDVDLLLDGRRSEEEAMIGDDPHEFALLRMAALRQFAAGERYAELFANDAEPIPFDPHAAANPSDPWAPSFEPVDLRAAAFSAPPAPETVVETATPREPEPTVEPMPKPVFVAAAESESEREPDAAPFEKIRLDPELDPVIAGAFTAPVFDPPVAEREAEPFVFTPDAVANAFLSDPDLEPMPVPELSRASEAELETPETARKQFVLWGTLWVLADRTAIAERLRAELWDYFGSEATAAMADVAGPDVVATCERRAAARAPMLVALPPEERRGMLEDILHLVLSGGELTLSEQRRIAELAAMVGLPAEEAADVASEYVDPEFADYRFQIGEEVEVRLDEEWLLGVVRRVESGGDLRIHFTATNEVLWLSPKADLIRPLSLGQTARR
ncbi:MAG TPA: hypothetical protein VNC50_16905 [Planctomycetia bacterium]|nr:hypothetical protein [Planctomycetia bacterium]